MADHDAAPVTVAYFSDVLCIWAYVAEVKLDALRREFGGRVRLDYRFISFFGNNHNRIGEGWKERGGFAGYGSHVCEVARRFDYVEVDPAVWTRNIPPTSSVAHQFLKAAQLAQEQGELATAPEDRFQGRDPFQELVWRVRRAFFRDLANVAERDLLFAIAGDIGLPLEPIRARMGDGSAEAALMADQEDRHNLLIEGSPTFLMNEGRQKLYGNVGYGVIAANTRALLERRGDAPVWQ